MTSDFSHSIITRFNLRNREWDNTTKNKTKVLTSEWLDNRFYLFENYCLPSVKNQSNSNFEWWVYFDTNTPESFKQRIKKIESDCNFFKPFYVNGMDEFLPNIKNQIKKSSKSYVITTRLDNDDCLHKNFVEYIQNEFVNQSYLALDIIDGYTLSIENVVQLGKKRHLYNPFITLIERNESPQSVWSRNHGDWKREKKVKRISNQRLWMSIIHDANKVNEYTGYGKVQFEQTLSNFGLAPQLIGELYDKYKFNPLGSIKNNFLTQWEVFFKDLKKSLGRYN